MIDAPALAPGRVMGGCRIETLRLFQFRNYAEVSLELGPALNIVSGRNAQGKTNLLEAVATLALTRSPRASTSADLIRWEAGECAVEARVMRPTGPTAVAVRFHRDPATARVTRTTTADGKVRSARSLLGICPVVLFWPDDLLLVKGSPEGRRRLLDTVLVQLEPRTALEMSRFRRSLEQRNALLRRIRDGDADPGSLEGFDAPFISSGGHLRAARAKLVEALADPAARALSDIGSAADRLDLRYVPDGDAQRPAPTSAEAAQRELALRISTLRTAEIARGQSLAGPHRDDVEILLGHRPARHWASQGQQRSVVLALKLAEVQHILAVAQAAPVLILDDVLSELDASHRDGLLEAVTRASVQTLVTTTDAPTLVSSLARADHFAVDAGSVEHVL